MSDLPGPMTVNVTCRTVRNSSEGATVHPVTMHPDGTLDTGHDLEQERILAAFGGYLSCLELVDVALPVVLEWWSLRQRRVARPITAKDQKGKWQSRHRAPCCRRGGHVAPRTAAEHARELSHVAYSRKAPTEAVWELARALPRDDPPAPRGEPWATLWQCGMHPDEVDRITAEVGSAEPLPRDFYLGVLARNPNLKWIRDTSSQVHLDSRDLVQLAWTYRRPDRRDPQLRAAWLRTGISNRVAVTLTNGPYELADAEAFAARWSVTLATACIELAKWQESEVTPAVSALIGPELDHLGFPPAPPPPMARWELMVATHGRFKRHEDLALAIIRQGSVAAAAAHLNAQYEKFRTERTQ